MHMFEEKSLTNDKLHQKTKAVVNEFNLMILDNIGIFLIFLGFRGKYMYFSNNFWGKKFYSNYKNDYSSWQMVIIFFNKSILSFYSDTVYKSKFCSYEFWEIFYPNSIA